jgi:ABC-type branched-subunit amino acid transport system ATPase component
MTRAPTHGTASVSERPIIETHDLTRRFGAITAVDRLNLSIPTG